MWIDATEEAPGPGRIINHSKCHPNVSDARCLLTFYQFSDKSTLHEFPILGDVPPDRLTDERRSIPAPVDCIFAPVRACDAAW